MCGIAGIVNFKKCIMPQIMVDMISSMNHRGPDGEGIFSDKNVILGHKRLSIIDIEGSSQPLSNEDNTVWVTFNGEIYNYNELRDDLICKGHQFRTDGDTETLVHLYEEYGSDMTNYLQGMFAFAIWDKQNSHLLLARDRIGIKPLYYTVKQGEFIFASEIKALLEHPLVYPYPKRESVWHYLTYRSVPAPDTLYEDIYKLSPGHIMIVNADGCKKRLYWDIPLNSPDKILKYNSEGEITESVESILLKSVKRRLISDVPLGAFLSGGLDSSLIVAMMSRLTGNSVKTYSVGFDNFKSSEVAYAQQVAEYYHTDHHELILQEKCFADRLELATWMRDNPLSEPADIPLYLLADMASNDVKVLLSGEGSDELFAGYPKYAYDRFASLIGWLPNSMVRGINSIVPYKFRRAEVALRSLAENNPVVRWSQWFAPFTLLEKIELFGEMTSYEDPIIDYAFITQGCNNLDAMLYVDCKLWLPENLLERGDRMTMAASVEGRVPFLDHELIEHAFTLPADVKIRNFTRKWQIKRIARNYLPLNIIDRQKVGFSLPLNQWFGGKLKDLCYDQISAEEGICRDLFDCKILQKILDDHVSGKKDNALKIWTLLTLSVWYQVFCRNSKVLT